MNTTLVGDRAPLPGWVGPAAGRIGLLSVARIGAQTLGFAWFVVAARWLSPAEFGACAAALTVVFVNGALADLGLTRTVSIRVARRPEHLREIVVAACLRRLGSGLAIGGASLVLAVAWSMPVTPELVALAAVVAAMSGVTEIGFAALRALGSVRVEVTLLIAERGAFGVAAVVALANGSGPVGVLASYALTNVASAVVVCVVIARRRRVGAGPGDRAFETVGWFSEPGIRWTAAASTLTVLAPRLATVGLMATATASQVGSFALAQKPAEALAFLAATIVSPVLPLMSAAGESKPAIQQRVVDFASLALALVTPGVALLVVIGPELISTAFGTRAAAGVGASSATLGLVALLVVFHLVAEAGALARGEPHRVAGAVLLGGVVTLSMVIAAPVPSVAWAAGAALAGEAVASVALVASSPILARRLITLVGPTVVRLVAHVAMLAIAAQLTRQIDDNPWVVVAVTVSCAGLIAALSIGRAAARLRHSLDVDPTT